MDQSSNIVSQENDSKSSLASTDPITEHTLTTSQLCEIYGTSIDEQDPFKSIGLTSQQIASKETKNSMTPQKKVHPFIQYLGYLKNVFTCLLLIAAFCSFSLAIADPSFTSHIWLGISLVFVAFFNAFLLFYQEYKTAALLESFMNMVPSKAMTYRDGRMQPISADQVVLGDLVYLRTGDKIPADLRLVYTSFDMKVDNSSLTGESEPQERNDSPCDYPNPLESPNLAFNGSLVVSGEGIGIAIRLGDDTILGQIAKATMTEEKRKAQLAEEIERFVKRLAALCVIVLIILVVAAFIHGLRFVLIINFSVGVLVSFVPEGLPITVTALLSLSAKRMADLNVLVKDLHGVETLGSITLLATDKTGTLTLNKMSVANIWINGNIIPANQIDINAIPNLKFVIDICGLCTKCKMDAEEFDKSDLNQRIIHGDGTEIGLYRYAMSELDKEILTLPNRFPKVHEIPFSSATKWHMTFHRLVEEYNNGDIDDYMILIKGAPERVLSKCSFMATNSDHSGSISSSSTIELTDDHREQFQKAYESFASKGQRVIGIGYKLVRSNEFDLDNPPAAQDPLLESGFVFIALISLVDPPKPGVPEAINKLRAAGIQIIMVTGDHPLTAQSIAKEIGLIIGMTKLDVATRTHRSIDQIQEDEYDTIIVQGEHIEELTEEEWDNILSKKEVVFARTSPKNKLEIVTRCQAKGHIVGVSGDGVNDSPALKKADLGISMNHSGSDVSKEAATMILMDDHFASIVDGVAQGRLLFSNLKKSIQYTLTHIPPEVLNYAAYAFFGIPLPLSPFLLLFVDLASELSPAFSYSWEPPESNLMLIPPRKVLCTEEKNYATFLEERKPKREGAQSGYRSSTIASNISRVEEGEPVPSIKYEKRTLYTRFKQSAFIEWINRFYHNHFASNETGEALVDTDMLIWSYLEAGLFLTAGCFGAYLFQMFYENVPFNLLWNTADTTFNDDSAPIVLTNGTVADSSMQETLIAGAQSAYYIGIVVGQMFTLFLVKKRYGMPWGKKMFKNKMSFLAIATAAAIAGVIIYVPALQKFIPTSDVYPIPYLMPLAAGTLLFIWEVIRRKLRQKGYFGGVPRTTDTMELVRRSTTVGRSSEYSRARREFAGTIAFGYNGNRLGSIERNIGSHTVP